MKLDWAIVKAPFNNEPVHSEPVVYLEIGNYNLVCGKEMIYPGKHVEDGLKEYDPIPYQWIIDMIEGGKKPDNQFVMSIISLWNMYKKEEVELQKDGHDLERIRGRLEGLQVAFAIITGRELVKEEGIDVDGVS